jgi:ZIP family zinc transporter
MLEAAFWGLVGGGALVLGALLGLRTRIDRRAIALVMAFGAGVLMSAVAFELTDEAYKRGGTDAVALGLALGAVGFFAADWAIDLRGGHERKRSGGQQGGGTASAIVLGSLMDGIPESMAIGITLLEGDGVGVAVVVAVFLSNVPESLAAATGLRRAGHSERWILGLWCAVALVSGLAAALGYGLLGGASDTLVGGIQAFAAGAILVMLADTMMPEAYAEGGRVVGLATALGFALAFLLSASG